MKIMKNKAVNQNSIVFSSENSADIFRGCAHMAEVGVLDICIDSARVTECNPALVQILGYTHRKQLLRLDIDRELYADPEEAVRLQHVLERDGMVSKYDIAFKNRKGLKIPVLLTAQARKNKRGRVTGYQGLVIDISERLAIEHELKEKVGFLVSLLESSVDCIVAADRKGIIVFFNKAAEKVMGYRAEEVIGRFHITRFYDMATAKGIMHKLRSDGYGGRGKLENLRLNFRRKDGKEIPVSLSASIVYKDEQEIATLGIFTDLREKLKMENELQEAQLRLMQSEKMASLGHLAAGVAHEINNPLGGILIYANLMLEECEAAGDRHAGDLRKIVDETARCKEIVTSLLEFGRQTEAGFEPLDINRAIIEGLFFLERQVLFHNITITKNLADGLPPVSGNPNQLKQVFMNIMVNAAEAMQEEHGQLTITTGKSASGTSVVTTFADTGAGIPAEARPKIFDPFFTTKEIGRGTGLGLSTSYGIIQSHHGSIEAESSVGTGTVFTIVLPCAGAGRLKVKKTEAAEG